MISYTKHTENKLNKIKVGQAWIKQKNVTPMGPVRSEEVIVNRVVESHVYFTYIEDGFYSFRRIDEFLDCFKLKVSVSEVWNELNEH